MATLAAGLSFAALARAECNNYICDNVKVLAMVTMANGDLWVRPAGTVTNLSCTLTENMYLKLPAGSTRFKEIYASLLASQMADRPTSLRIDIGSQGCTINYIITTAP